MRRAATDSDSVTVTVTSRRPRASHFAESRRAQAGRRRPRAGLARGLNLNLKATDDIEAFNLKLKRCGPIAGVTVGGHSPGPLQACHCGPWTRNLNFKLKLKVTVTQRPSSLTENRRYFHYP